MTLNDILHSAQGGQAVANLGAQFGLAPEAAEAAVQAMIPVFSAGLTAMAANPAAIGAVLNELASGAHAASYADPSQTAGASGLGAPCSARSSVRRRRSTAPFVMSRKSRASTPTRSGPCCRRSLRC